MNVILLSFVVLLFIVIAMSVGVLCGRKPIKGSCGGMSSLGMETACDICGGDTQKCDKKQAKNSSKASDNKSDATFYNVG